MRRLIKVNEGRLGVDRELERFSIPLRWKGSATV